jgi:mevalonate kinase
MQDDTDETRKKAIEVSSRTKEELQPALSAVQSEMIEVKAGIQEDAFEHQTKITRLSQEVDTLRAVVHNILSETTVDHFWPERRVVMANAHGGGGGAAGGGAGGLYSLPPTSTSAHHSAASALGVAAWESDAPLQTRPGWGGARR